MRPPILSYDDVAFVEKGSRVPGIEESIKIAISQGKKFFLRFGEIGEITNGSVVGTTSDIRVYLNVPYSEKEEAKKHGARWTNEKKKWYGGGGSGSKLEKLACWTDENDRVFLNCSECDYRYAILRGAILTKDNRIFIPKWYMLDSSIKWTVERVCYWLPPDHEKHRFFKDSEEAALYIAQSAGYTPISAYLPEEKKMMEFLCKKRGWYIYECENPDQSYFRCKVWDTW